MVTQITVADFSNSGIELKCLSFLCTHRIVFIKLRTRRKYVSATVFTRDCALHSGARHDHCFFASTNLYCFLQQNYSPNFLHVKMSLENQSCSYAIPPDVQIWIIKGRFYCGSKWMCIAWPYGHARLLRVNLIFNYETEWKILFS
jgi:hypothetical protein